MKRLALLSILFLAGCAGIPNGVSPVHGFEPSRYLGAWYEIARLDHSFERGLTRVTATYSLREDGGIKGSTGVSTLESKNGGKRSARPISWKVRTSAG